jgi:DNA-binding NarL/FixJ family response regulator
MDHDMPFTDGLEDTKMVISRFPDSRVIIVSMPSEKTMAATLCQAWACYHLCKKCSAHEILAAIRRLREMPGNGSEDHD